MGRRKPIIGLSGGIGSGKSSVAAMFAEMGALVIGSDALNHDILRQDKVLETLARWWGADVVQPDGQPNRTRIAEIVFGDAEQKRRLESLTYPLIAAAREDMISRGNLDPAVTAIVIDSPLLFECNLDRQCDKTVFVEANEELRLERLRARRGWDAGELRRRESWQLPLSEKRARADFVIVNEGPLERLRPQVAAILEQIAAGR
ncbi:MAG: dephospho-CoA kinase [Phycisphaerae bacterium]|jgi:dephospho-CoA kinase|nr:dephospho-CoA kinase [Phycisphaerae bacterium]MCZ2400836.1 dephospho-CoA kinase [Phycisphaerae bacterium]NUQ48752.1 dephospho-CoA kinase [Phycisphaerae bacterium]